MVSKSNLNQVLSGIVGLLVYLLLFGWLNDFNLRILNPQNATDSYSLVQKICVFVYISLGLYVNSIVVAKIKSSIAAICAISYTIIMMLGFAASLYIPKVLAAGLLILLTSGYAVVVINTVIDSVRREMKIRNLLLHLLFAISLQFILYDRIAYSNILYLVLILQGGYMLLTKVLHGAITKYAGAWLSMAYLMCVQHFSIRSIFLLSFLMSLAIAILPNILYSADSASDTFTLIHAWYLNALVLICSVVALLITISSISTDFATKTIYTIASKPVSRTGYLAGKLFGSCVVVLPLTLYFMLCFFLVMNIMYRGPIGQPELFEVAEIIEADFDNNQEFIMSVDQSMMADGLEKNDTSERRDYYNKQRELYKMLSYDSMRTYLFPLPARINETYDGKIRVLFRPNVRYSVETTPLIKFRLWLNGREFISDQTVDDTNIFECRSLDEVEIDITEYVDLSTNEVKFKLENISEASKADGQRPTVIFGRYMDSGMTLSLSGRSYLMNCLKIIVVLTIQLFFVIVVSLFAASLLEFPVAVLLATSIMIIAFGHLFFEDNVEFDTGKDEYTNLLDSLDFRWRIVIDSYEKVGVFAAFKSIIGNMLDLILAYSPSFKGFVAINKLSQSVYIVNDIVVNMVLSVLCFWSTLYFFLSSVLSRKKDIAHLVI